MWKTTKGTVLGKDLPREDYVSTESGIILAGDDKAETVPFRCEVLASGVEGVEPGDTVLYMASGRTYSAFSFRPTVEAEELVNVHELCILAVVDRGLEQ